jgi:hypothetical protein
MRVSSEDFVLVVVLVAATAFADCGDAATIGTDVVKMRAAADRGGADVAVERTVRSASRRLRDTRPLAVCKNDRIKRLERRPKRIYEDPMVTKQVLLAGL